MKVVNRHEDGDKFISMWELFPQIAHAERVQNHEGARYLYSALKSNLTNLNLLRELDEAGRILPLETSAQLRIFSQLSILAQIGTFCDEDGRPNNEAQPIFERFGFYASDIYPLLNHNDVVVSRPNDDAPPRHFPDGRIVPSWLCVYDNQEWLSRHRVVMTLLEGVPNVKFDSFEFSEVYDKWDAALREAINRGHIATKRDSEGRQLSHKDIIDWCVQHGYPWALMANDMQETGDSDTSAKEDKNDLPPSSSPELDSGLAVREMQIRALEVVADELGYPRKEIPKGGKGKMFIRWQSKANGQFGVGKASFDGAWKAASKANRITIANRHKFKGG